MLNVQASVLRPVLFCLLFLNIKRMMSGVTHHPFSVINVFMF